MVHQKHEREKHFGPVLRDSRKTTKSCITANLKRDVKEKPSWEPWVRLTGRIGDFCSQGAKKKTKEIELWPGCQRSEQDRSALDRTVSLGSYAALERQSVSSALTAHLDPQP